MPPVAATTVPSPVLVNPKMPKDPHLRAIAEDVLAKLKYSFAAAAAGEHPSAPGGMDRMFQKYLATRKPAARARYGEHARALLASPLPIRSRDFRRYAAVDAQAYRALGSDRIGERVGKLAPAVAGDDLKLRLEKFTRAVFKLPSGFTGTPILTPDHAAGLAFKKMSLFIRRVTCLGESNEWSDSDEINLGGTATDPLGNTTLVPEFVVSDDFDEGEQVDFGWGKVFHTWDIVTKSGGFPYLYSAVIAVGEKDQGGFSKFLQDLWAEVGSEVTNLIGTAVGAAVGAAIGAAFAGIGAIVGAAIGAFIGWLISFFADFEEGDDVVGADVVLITLTEATKSFYDSLGFTSPDGWPATLEFARDGEGHYRVETATRVFA
jgi:hypothetical protein